MPRKYIKVAERRRLAAIAAGHAPARSSSSSSSSNEYQRGLSQGKTIDDLLRSRWTSIAGKQLSRWRRRDEYGYFHEPVNEEYAPDYHKIIKKPMDFSTMQSKLEKEEYKTYKQFADDFELVCTNCMKYNPPTTPFYKFAKQMLEVGNRAIAASADRSYQYELRLKKDKKTYLREQKRKEELQKIERREQLKEDKRKFKDAKRTEKGKRRRRKDRERRRNLQGSDEDSDESSTGDGGGGSDVSEDSDDSDSDDSNDDEDSSDEDADSSEEDHSSEDADDDSDSDYDLPERRGRGRPRMYPLSAYMRKKYGTKPYKKKDGRGRPRKIDTKKNNHKKND
jgi:hypothetical protein